ncbi:hypothetical protein DBB42_14710 [Pseudomonas plecoglossicida]|uniref:Uncharacterized protein n=1 Tax=Pseudomonas plecoglossicida TaxID=70775 RepID=A0A2R7UGX2_PSEDL|nr:hypothetical protein DBB42_14710 [Pseudomonas plecoglossicida]
MLLKKGPGLAEAPGLSFWSVPHLSGIHRTCRSGLVSRKGCKAAPAFFASMLKSRGRSAALSRHKAAPTKQFSSRT